MGWFKNKKEEREAYIEKKIAEARELSYDKLKKEVYLKKFNLIQLKEEIKTSPISILISILFSTSTIIISWVTLFSSITSNSINIFDTTVKLIETIGDEEKKEMVNSFVDMVSGNIDLSGNVIMIVSIFIILAMVCMISYKLIIDNKIGKIGKMEIELDILTEELDNRKEIILKDINEKNGELNNKNIIKEVAVSETSK